MSGGGGGAGGGLITDENARLLVEDEIGVSEIEGASETSEQPLIDWSEEVDLPGVSAGDSLGGWGAQYRLWWGQEVYLHAGQVYLGAGAPIAPNWTQHALAFHSKTIQSIAGIANVHHADTPSAWACGLGLGSSGGWREDEWWTVLTTTLPSPPSDVAGIIVTITLADLAGAATGGRVYVRDSAPTAGRSGTLVATIGAGATEVLIPYSAITGSEVWIGVGPAWQADYHYTTATHGLGDEGACVGGYTAGNGTLRVSAISSATWAVYSSSSESLGTTVVIDDEENGPTWEGGNALTIAAIEGTPDVDVADGGLHVTGAGGFCVMAQGDVEDEDEPAGPWGTGWSVSFPFDVDVLGSPAEIEVTTTRPGQSTIGRISLDSTPTISVETPIATDTATIGVSAGERWIARFDDRSGWLRGKVWQAGTTEPADWAVEVELPNETSDSGDRVVICVRAGASQTVSLYRVSARAEAEGTWVREKLGQVSGTTDRFVLNHPHVVGTLWFDVGGCYVPPSREESGFGWLDYVPTPGMLIWANYLSA